MRQSDQLKIIGVTGNTGSGKSSVCAALSELGGFIIDTDEIAHEIIMRGAPAYDEVITAFGPGILDKATGEIDRKKLGMIVFHDKEKLEILTAVTHKHIITEADGRIRKARENPGTYRFIAVDAPLLYEAGMDAICDGVILVTAPEDVRLARIIGRDGITRGDAEKRSRSRTDADDYTGSADLVIVNDGDMRSLREKVRRFAEKFII